MTEPNTNTPKEEEIIPQVTPSPAVPSMPPSPAEVGKAVAAKQSAKEEAIAAAKPVVAPTAATEVIQRVNLLHPEVRPHAFVVMPFGKKKGGDGSLYDFNEIYKLL